MKKYKQKRKLITIQCDGCKINFEKPESEYNRNINKGRRNFCSRECVGKHNYSHLKKSKSPKISNFSSNKKSFFTPYKYYMKLVKQRFKDYDITLEDLHNQWEKQKGICPYSGIKLKLSTHSNILKNPITTASLDRVDSSKGYLKDNIQFVSRSINFMKGEMSHKETIQLCKLIAKKYK